ncbi:MAG: efflux RND transporter permease subunit [Planctomycetota bacterium]|jgi:predicted RND superfamily exporter protein
MDRLAILFGRHRLLLSCGVAAMTAVCLYGMNRVTFDNDPLKLLRSDRFEIDALEGEFARLERTGLIVVEGENLMTPEGVDAVRQIVRGAAAVEGVEDVYSMLDVRDSRRVGRYLLPLFPSSEAPPDRFERAQRRARSHPLLIGHFLSEDMTTALVLVQFEPWVASFSKMKPVLERLHPMLADCTKGSGVRTRITGTAALEVEIIEKMRHDIFLLSSLGAALVLGIAVVMFRRVGAALLVASGPAVGTLWTVGTLGLIGEPINMLTNVVPVLVLVIGFTDSMHLVLHVRRAMAEGSPSLEAAQSAIRHLGLACALTSLSTAAGFGSLLVASLDGIQTFGWCCALGSVLSFFAVITVVPLLASTRLGRHVVGAKSPRRRRALGGLADGILAAILRRPRVVLACAAALTLTLAHFVIRLEPDHTIATEIPHSSEAYRALEHVDETFGGMMFAYAVVRWPEEHSLGSQELYDVLGKVHQAFDASPVMSNPLSILSLVGSLPGEGKSLAQRARELRYVPDEFLGRLVDVDRRRAVVSAHLPDVGARLLKPAFADADRQFQQLARRHPGFEIDLTGASVAVFRNIHLMIEDLWRSLATAAGVMFLMIWVGFRSWRYALVSVWPNLFPLLCTGAFIVLSGRHLEMTSVIVFSISLGIAVDDTIHFLARFKREMRSERDPRVAVRRTFHVVGTALVMTTVALVAGHGIVMMSGFPAIRVFGILAAVTIASALVGDLLILPAILVGFKGLPGATPNVESPPRSNA